MSPKSWSVSRLFTLSLVICLCWSVPTFARPRGRPFIPPPGGVHNMNVQTNLLALHAFHIQQADHARQAMLMRPSELRTQNTLRAVYADHVLRAQYALQALSALRSGGYAGGGGYMPVPYSSMSTSSNPTVDLATGSDASRATLPYGYSAAPYGSASASNPTVIVVVGGSDKPTVTVYNPYLRYNYTSPYDYTYYLGKAVPFDQAGTQLRTEPSRQK